MRFIKWWAITYSIIIILIGIAVCFFLAGQGRRDEANLVSMCIFMPLILSTFFGAIGWAADE